MATTIQSRLDPATRDIQLMIRLGEEECMGRTFLENVMKMAAREIADKIIQERFGEIMALIDPQSIANLSIAESAAKIRETLEKKIPDKILEINTVEREVWQRGIFGGLSRL